jgi:hypothetical protein
MTISKTETIDIHQPLNHRSTECRHRTEATFGRPRVGSVENLRQISRSRQ